MEQKELTYILGAGASFESIPLVKTFPRRFNEFYGFLQNNIDLNQPTGYVEHFNESLNKIKSFAENLVIEFESHQSFDTFFKKLFHTKKYPEIKVAKKVLHLYFIWEHLDDGKLIHGAMGEIVNPFIKKAKVDRRYDALIAGLLKPLPDEPELFCKTNFITWNYDLNLLCSIKNYFYPNETFKEFMDSIQTECKNIFSIKNQIFIFNMNGYFYSNVFDDAVDIRKLWGSQLLKLKLQIPNYFDNSYSDSDAELITFAWEDNSTDMVNRVKERVVNTDTLVVIGYTFPLYNRLIDKQYITGGTLLNKTIYIQDPDAEVIKSEVIESFRIGQTALLKPYENCNNFFVPRNILKM
jgi:hypothetical protein